MHLDILKEEEDAATEFPSLLKLLSKKITLSGNSSLTRKWWYEVMTSRPPPLPKNSEILRESILDRVEEGWQEEDWVTTMPKLICTLLQESPTSTRNLPSARVSHAAKGVQWVHLPPKWSIPKKKMAPRASVEGNPRSGAKLLNV